METGVNTSSQPAEQPLWATPAWGRRHLDYVRSEGDARRPNTHAEQAAAQDLDLWITRIKTGERLALGICIGWLLTSRHLRDGTCTMADVAFCHWAAAHTHHTTMEHPSQLHYVSTRLMAQMGTYSPAEMNRLHWQWHQRRALRVPAAMQRHNIWSIRKMSLIYALDILIKFCRFCS